MTEVAFHFNAPEKWEYMCRLLRKAVVRGSRVAVTGDDGVLRRLDRDLWAFSAVDFIAHCDATSEPGMLAASPVVLCKSPSGSPHRQVLLNLGSAVPVGFERFERLIEVVGTDDADRAGSRQRWKYYLDRGYAIARHDLASKEAH